MSTTRPRCSLLTLAFAAALGGCASDTDLSAPPPAGLPPAAEARASDLAATIEQAQRQIDRGHDVAGARDALVDALANANIVSAERVTAAMALSLAHEVLGDDEAAIRTVEDAVAATAEDREIDREPLQRRLRRLLTGTEESPDHDVSPREPSSPFARALLDVFPADAHGRVSARFIVAGGDDRLSAELGTFNLREALREKKEEACPLCQLDVNVSRSIRQSNWLVLPESLGRLDDAMLVVYFDLGNNRVPARYDALLPMPSADIVAELEAGKSFTLARERPGKPPVLLLAAPRTALLDEVERHLAGMDHLPFERADVEVAPKLQAREIQSVMRGQWFKQIRGCYEAVLTGEPTARGRVIASFAIDDTGKVEGATAEADTEVLDRGDFLRCVTTALEQVRFPRGGERTTVTYPVLFTPDAE